MHEPDRELLALINDHAQLSPVGEVLFEQDLYWGSQVAHKLSQNLAREPVTDPVFITGTGRTASSFLHAQLRDAGLRVANVFEATTLVRRTGQDLGWLIHDVDRHIRLGDEQSPEYAMVNPHQWNDPAEDIHFDRASFATPWWLCHYGGILDWAMARMFADPIGDLEHLRSCAEMLGRPEDRWCFRATTYLMRLESLFEVFPDATVIWMERDVAEVEPSLRKMLGAMRRTRSDYVDVDEVAMLANSMATVGPAVAEQTIADGKVPLDRIVRVSFEDLTENTDATVAGILRRLSVHARDPV